MSHVPFGYGEPHSEPCRVTSYVSF